MCDAKRIISPTGNYRVLTLSKVLFNKGRTMDLPIIEPYEQFNRNQGRDEPVTHTKRNYQIFQLSINI